MKIIYALLLIALGVVILVSTPAFYGKGTLLIVLVILAFGIGAFDRKGDKWL